MPASAEDFNVCYNLLDLPYDASLKQLDEAYLGLVRRWAKQGTTPHPSARDLYFKAYDTIRTRLRAEQTQNPEPARPQFTMREVITHQDQIIPPSTTGDRFWYPPGYSNKLPSRDTFRIEDVDLGKPPGFSIEEIKCDIADAPDRAVIVHSVNCKGVWGFGFAAELKKMCPAAYEVYKAHCKEAGRPYDLVGTCLLIPPQAADFQQSLQVRSDRPKTFLEEVPRQEPRRWIACLFTSLGYGQRSIARNNPGRDAPLKILKNTRIALEELRTRLEDFGPSNFDQNTREITDDLKPGEIWSPRFNSGAFGVPWNDTQTLLLDEFEGFERPWTIVDKMDNEYCETSEYDS